MFPLLQHINSPQDLRALPQDSLPTLASELRQFLLHTLSQTGGHLGAGLGVVELTIALHYVYNTPEDKLVWDIGHQCYPHKILTGRRDQLHTIRLKDGLSSFLKRSESSYDTFGAGHSSTSISAALGMATAAKLQNKPYKTVAIIGDGAMTAGMAFEALNHAGDLGNDLLVILNDNDMSISENVGALSNYLARILSGKMYTTFKAGSKKILEPLPLVTEWARRTEEHVKGMIAPGTLFEELGFNYIGPIDGHDLSTLLKTLKNMRELRGPQLLHIATTKGKGYTPAEEKPIAYHAVPQFDISSGTFLGASGGRPSYSKIFGDWLCDMAKCDTRLVGITPAMREGSGMVRFSKEFPDRYFDVGIAEQHSVTLAAGMACEGLKPVVAIYSTFLQRAYDQLIHDVAIQNLDVLFALDRAGVVGADGATHHGNFDLSFLRCIPNLVIMAPSNEDECRQMLYTGFMHKGPAAVRYPRGTGPGTALQAEFAALPIGKGEVVRQGQRTVILAFGTMVPAALQAAEELDATVVNMRFVKPLDATLIVQMAKQHELVVTLEDNAARGGAGSAVLELLANSGIMRTVLILGLPDEFIEQGTQEELLRDCGLDADGVVKQIRRRLTMLGLASSAPTYIEG